MTLLVLGCAQPAPSGSDYLLAAVRRGAPATASGEAILEVRRFSIDAEFANRGLVYRTGDFKYETDAYREFLISPAQMLTERTRDWLSRSGLFEQVVVPGSRLQATHTLEGNVLALYGDLRDASARAAVMELRCFLLADEGAPQRVLLARDYKSVKPLQADSAEALVEALDECLVEILTNLENDLGQLSLASPP
ncbi:MAG: membrane integrity-associated transporter subunit PqiC [Sedimentisphaerales bacterium]|nr:membrane integrity-associated transporter subunit PqiC [Sedimentisphaerales bacterium]